MLPWYTQFNEFSICYRNLPAVALFSVREAYFDADEARKFEAYLPALVAMHVGQGEDSKVVPPSKEVYQRLRKSDPFMMRTESMYT